MEVSMIHLFTRFFFVLASPILLVIYWRNNMKKIDLDDLHLVLSYNDLGSFFSEN